MYLMNVPPVAATQTEWRTCGPPGGYSLPICFNDSENDLPTTGTPISNKVQMIIESLRSSQSSLEMADEIEGNVPSGQDGHPQVRKVAMGPYVGANSKTKGPTENRPAHVSSQINHGSSDSDSDDSVDRGIEEAILEYLKEKDDHKRKPEPCFAFPQPSKIPRKTSPVPEVSNQNSDSNRFMIASNQFPKSVKAETATASATIPIKKYIKNKASLDDDAVRKLDSNKSTCTQTITFVLPKEQTKSSSKTINVLNKVQCPLKVKVEEDSNDSSSDDGIEEAIQRYQLEQKVQQNKPEASNSLKIREDSDSTSDDGIEEAIRSYQLEQIKEKSVLTPFLPKQKPFKSVIHAIESTSTENMKKHKRKKKKNRMEKEGKSNQPPPSLASVPKNTLSESSKGKGNGLLLFKVNSLKEQPTPVPPKASTPAELMCAEAILDISKTVMPVVFHPAVGLSSCAPTESLPPDNGPDIESDGSSIDSEDGIELEIRKFLEQKAQMNQQPPSSAVAQEPNDMKDSEEMKAKPVATQKNPSKLSLTRRRKSREEICNVSNISSTDNVAEAALKPLSEHRKESSPLGFSQRSRMHLTTGLHETEKSGEKSSSLDSDEDLDTAIKDLLKTKKKVKKKNRDLKRKPRKCLKDEEPTPGSVSQTKKFKPDPISKNSALKKVHKNKKDILQHKQTEDYGLHEGETEKLKATEGQDAMKILSTARTTVKEDSSSVDSDDSIELEIRKFLAEKAKVSTAEKSKEGDDSRNGSASVCSTLQVEDIKQENQLAEIPIKSISPLSVQSLLTSKPLPRLQRSLPSNSTVSAQSQRSSVQSCSPFLEPADGAGAAKTEQTRLDTGRSDVQDLTPQPEKAPPVLTPNISHSRSESIKWRQSFGLPATDTRALNRTAFHITSSKISKTASATPSYPSGGASPKLQTPVSGWSSARTSRAAFPCSTETVVNTKFKTPVLSLLSTAKQEPRISFIRSATPGLRSECPKQGDMQSMVHMPKDKSVFVELETNRTNHVQVRSRERSEGKERVDLLSEIKVESESVKIDDKEVHLERTAEEFIDEADCESDHRGNPEKNQGFSTLSLSRAIDPGITISPCIALSTDERSSMYSRSYLTEKSKKGVTSRSRVPVQNKCVQRVKRKLQFMTVNRGNAARNLRSITE